MLSAILIVLILVFAAWVYYEFKAPRRARFACGLAAIVILTLGWASTAFRLGHIGAHEWPHINASLRRLEQILSNGDIATAQAAIAAYNTALANTGDPYEASMELWQSIPPN